MKPIIVEYPFGDNPPKSTLYYGQDVRESLKLLPDQSVQCVCTSPPFWGLRDYGTGPLIWGGDPDCDHDWGVSDRLDPVPPAKRQCKGCGRFGTTRWMDSSSTTTVCENCGLETDHDEVTTKGNLIGVKDTSNTEDWTTNKSKVPYTGYCQKCGAWKGSFGLEPNPDLYVEHLVEVFTEIWRVLRDDGVVWLNLGDSYMSAPAKDISGFGGFQGERIRKQKDYQESRAVFHRPKAEEIGLKFKDLVGIPWMVAFALRKAGWYLRSDIIWSKKNPMPESTRDRPTKAHEYVFLLTKSEKYFYDQEAIREPCSEENVKNMRGRTVLDNRTDHGGSRPDMNKDRWAYVRPDLSRNKRTVWTVNPKPYKGAHFAVWPEKLVEPMVLAGSSGHGCCVTCGAPMVRVIKKGEPPPEPAHRHPTKRLKPGQPGNVKGGNMGFRASKLSGQEMSAWKASHPDRTTNWKPTCKCDVHAVPCTILDPFSGSATTGAVAMRLGRDYIGIDLNDDYLGLAVARLQGRPAPEKVESADNEDDVLDFLS